MRTLLRDLGTVSGVQCACIVRGGQVLATTFAESDAVAQAASLGLVRGISDGLELVDRGLEELQIDFQGRSLLVAPVAKDFVLAMLAAPDANSQLLRVVMGSSVRQLRRMHDIAEKPVPAAAAPQPAAAAPAAPAAARPGAPQPPQPPQPQAAAAKPGGAAPPPPKPAAPPPPSAPQAAKPAPTGRPQPPPPPGRPAAPPPPPPPGRPAAAATPQPAKPAQAAQAQPAQPAQPAATTAPAAGAAPAKPAAKPETAAPPAAAKPAEKDAEPVLPQVLALLTEYIGPVARVSFKRGVTRWRETSTPTVGTLNELAKILAADLSTDSEKKAFMDAVDRLRGS